MAIERTQDAAGMSNFSRVEKLTWQPADRSMWVVPATQQLMISAARGGAVALGGVTVVSMVFAGLNLWDIVGLAIAVGALVFLVDFAGGITDRFETFRAQELSRETYERESGAQAARVEERVVIETREARPGGATQTLIDQLRCSQDDLVRLARAPQLSVRALQNEGFSFNTAMRLLQDLKTQNFIQYGSDNQPATWTSKGYALVRHYQNHDVEEV